LVYGPLDVADTVIGRRDARLPPRRLRFVGGGDFEQVGQEFLGHFIELGGLQPGARVLDAGCGVGRMAIPLTDFLDESGSYEGFDVVRAGIRWCQRTITPQRPSFRFQHADLHNATYNPRGRLEPQEYRFPYRDAEFDFAFLTSVFTHMLPAGVERYVTETARVLKPGATALITWFLLNEPTRAVLGTGRCRPNFKHDHGAYRTIDEAAPEAAVAYDEDFMRKLLESRGLEIVEPIHFGRWRGTKSGRSAQDIVVARRQ
jgi:SAM-dependent methyltransferase